MLATIYLGLTIVGRAAPGEPSAGGDGPGSRPPPLFVHDPSTVVRDGAEYWFFSTGQGISSRHSRDLRQWEAGPPVFTRPPAWTQEIVPDFRGHFWAPDLLRLGDRYLLYYSVSKWGTNRSAIGLATNPTLDPADPAYAWMDRGIVLQTRGEDRYNAIDPAVFLDADGRLWLVFGSFWNGIALAELDPATGGRLKRDAPLVPLAWHEAIEAPYLLAHRGGYYLFVNWGQCCRGVQSTYEIRVGRATRVTGPYVGKDGVDLLHRGGALFLATRGQRIGPGHAAVRTEAGRQWFSYHYYDGSRRGLATFGLGQLRWDAQDWPVFVPEPER